MGDIVIDLPKAALELAEALAALEAARLEMQQVSREETHALNRVNAAQKAFDQQVAAERKRGTMDGTDWGREERNKAAPDA